MLIKRVRSRRIGAKLCQIGGQAEENLRKACLNLKKTILTQNVPTKTERQFVQGKFTTSFRVGLLGGGDRPRGLLRRFSPISPAPRMEDLKEPRGTSRNQEFSKKTKTRRLGERNRTQVHQNRTSRRRLRPQINQNRLKRLEIHQTAAKIKENHEFQRN